MDDFSTWECPLISLRDVISGIRPAMCVDHGRSIIKYFPFHCSLRLVPLIYIWRLEENHTTMYFLLFAAGTKILFLPVIVKPHIALTLIIELDVHHLSKWKEYLSKDSLPAYVDLVGIVKTKWRKFLRYHFGIEIVPPLAYIVAMILLLFGMHPHPEVLMVVSAAPLSMAYLWLQVLPLASFNEMVSDWQLSTDDNDTFRILWQKEKDLMLLVLFFCLEYFHLNVQQLTMFHKFV